MSTTSKDLKGGPRSKLGLLDLSREIRDQVYGLIVDDRYKVFPYLRLTPFSLRPFSLRGDDFRDLSILRASKCVSREVMQVLQMKSWFICILPSSGNYCTFAQAVPTQHMMNIELLIDEKCS